MQEVALAELSFRLVDMLDLLIIQGHAGHEDLDHLIGVQVAVGIHVCDFGGGPVGQAFGRGFARSFARGTCVGGLRVQSGRFLLLLPLESMALRDVVPPALAVGALLPIFLLLFAFALSLREVGCCVTSGCPYAVMLLS